MRNGLCLINFINHVQDDYYPIRSLHMDIYSTLKSLIHSKVLLQLATSIINLHYNCATWKASSINNTQTRL